MTCDSECFVYLLTRLLISVVFPTYSVSKIEEDVLLLEVQQQQRQLAEVPQGYDLPLEHVVSSPTSRGPSKHISSQVEKSTSVDRRAIFAAFLPLAIEKALGLLPFLFEALFILAFFFSAFAPEWGAR